MVRLYWLGEVLDSTPIAIYTVISIQIGQLFRKISTDKLFRRHTHTHTHVKLKTSFLGVSVLVGSRNVLSLTLNFWRYSNTSIRSTNMEVKICSLLNLLMISWPILVWLWLKIRLLLVVVNETNMVIVWTPSDATWEAFKVVKSRREFFLWYWFFNALSET